MLFPIKHENMKARRWPLVTIGLILVNTLVFLCIHQTMEDQEDPLLTSEGARSGVRRAASRTDGPARGPTVGH